MARSAISRSTSGHGQIVAGYLLVVRDDVLLAQRVDEASGHASGTKQRRHDGRRRDTGGTKPLRGLTRASCFPPHRRRELASWRGSTRLAPAPGRWARRGFLAGAAVTRRPLRRRDHAGSPASNARHRVVPAASGAVSQPLTLALAADSDPVWSPDGRRIAFRSLQTGRPALFTKRAHDQDAEDETLIEGDATPTDWRGSDVIVQMADARRGTTSSRLTSMAPRTTIVKSGFNDTDGRWSPDGAWLAYVSDESGRPDIYANRREWQSSAGLVRRRHPSALES